MRNTTVKIATPSKRGHVSDPDLPKMPKGHSYPDHYILSIDLPAVGRIKVRPIVESDAAMLEALFRSLTPHSVYLRFFSFLRDLPAKMLERFTRIDYQREVALVALRKEEGEEIMVGDARVVETAESGIAEFSVMVSDPWQGKGIGACLLKHCLAIAAHRGYRRICGIVLPENKQMLALGRKLGFKIERISGSTEYELSKDMVSDEK